MLIKLTSGIHVRLEPIMPAWLWAKALSITLAQKAQIASLTNKAYYKIATCFAQSELWDFSESVVITQHGANTTKEIQSVDTFMYKVC